MPQLQNLVLTDRATTPVNHTFVPRDIIGVVATVVESTGVPVGNNRVSMSLRNTGQGNYRATLQFAFPIVASQVVNGITTPVVVRTSYVDLEFKFSNNSSEQERKDVVGQVMSALDPSKVLINDLLTKLQGVY